MSAALPVRRGPEFVQLSLGLLGVPDRVMPRPRRLGGGWAQPCRKWAALGHFQSRLAATGASRKTQQAYVFQMEQLLAAARRHGLGPGDGLVDLFRNVALLGRALVDDRATRGGTL